MNEPLYKQEEVPGTPGTVNHQIEIETELLFLVVEGISHHRIPEGASIYTDHRLDPPRSVVVIQWSTKREPPPETKPLGKVFGVPLFVPADTKDEQIRKLTTYILGDPS